MKVVGYVRVSTNSQDFERQKDDINKYAEYKGYQLITFYEEKLSGLKKSRPALSKMLMDVSSGDIDYIIISELSRLGRTQEVLNTIEKLSNSKIGVISLKENITTLNEDKTINSTSELIISVLSGINKFEIDTMKYRQNSGFISKIKDKPIWKGKYVPYGYTKNEKVIVIDENESNVVKEIYQLYRDGNSTWKISNILNEKGISTKTGKLWKDSIIYKILTNSMYKGERIYTIGKDNQNKKIYDTFPFPQIVDVILFDEVQEIIKSNVRKQDNNKKYNYILDNKLIECGICGLTYFPFYKPSGKDNRYICISRRYPTKGCSNFGINIDKLELSVKHILVNYFTDILFQNKDTSNLNSELNKITQDIELMEKLLYNENKKEKQLLDLFLNGTIDNSLFHIKQSELKEIQTRYKKELVKLNKEKEVLTKRLDDIENIQKFSREIRKGNLKRDIVRKVINKIIIYPEYNQSFSTFKNDKYVKIVLYIGSTIFEYYLSHFSKHIEIPLNKNIEQYINKKTTPIK